jgi:hypothetical protein
MLEDARENEFFTYQGLRRYLKHLIGRYRIFRLGKWDGKCPGIILRHDVDFDLEAAYRVALLESELGIKSTFYVRVDAYSYNLFSDHCTRRLQQMISLGFEIGLHFNPMRWPDANENELVEMAFRDMELLRLIVPSIKSISLHNPSVHGHYPMIPGVRNSYDPMIFTPEKYLSDSCMSFRGKDPYSHAILARENVVQIVLHPMHYADNPGTYKDRIAEYHHFMDGLIADDFQDNATYEKQKG